MSSSLLVAPIVLVLLLTLLFAVRIVWQYQRGVVFRFGKLVGERGPGLNFIIPFIDRMIKVDMRVYAASREYS